MEIDKLMQFLGLPAQNKEFDSYLSFNGIFERPHFTSSPVERLNWEEGGLSLIFRTIDGYEESWGKARERGIFIFSTLQVYGSENDSGFSQFQGKLPFNLTFNTTLAEAKKIFGEPTVDHNSGPNHVYVWHGYHGDTISLCFLPDDRGISFVDLAKAKKNPPMKIDW